MTDATAPGPRRLSRSNTRQTGAPRSHVVWWAVPLLLFSIIVYLPPYKQAFVGDDYLHLGYIAEFLDRPLAAIRVFNPFWTDWYYRPLQNVWILFCRLLFGLNPFGYYFLQTLWHAVAAASLVALARKLQLRAQHAAVALVLFLVHSHHHDVVAWISSLSVIMATTFSLLAVLHVVHSLQDKTDHRSLPVAALFVLLALLSHEEAILLPIYLLAACLVLWTRRTITAREGAFAAILLLPTVALGLTHFIRPNSTITLHEQSLDHWLAALHPLNLAGFTLTVPARWLLLNKSVAGMTILTTITRLPALTIVLAIGIAGALIYGFWRGNKIIRLALLWAVLHFSFLYLTLWRQEPALFAGRHLYSSWAFIALALASLVVPLRARFHAPFRNRLLWTLLALFYAVNVLFIGDDQRAWRRHTIQVASVEAQMKELIPEVTADTRIFAHRFVLLPGFTPFAAAVWYAEPGISGGSLDRMREQSVLTRHTYLLDYVDGRLHNLLPDLQEHDRTSLLWQAPRATTFVQAASATSPAMVTLHQTAGPQNARRLAIRLRPPGDGRLSLIYDVDVDPQTYLATDVLGQEGTAFRIRLLTEGGRETIAAATTITSETAGVWHPHFIPLTIDGNVAREIYLDVHGPASDAYWSVPRLVYE